MSKVRSNVLWLLTTQMSGYVFPLLTIPYLIRVLGMGNYGFYALVLSITQYYFLIVEFGHNLSATREVALNKVNVSQVYCATMVAKLVLCIILLIPTLFFVLKYYPNYFTVTTILSFAIIGTAFFPLWLYQGLEKMRIISLVSVFTRALVLCGTFLFVKKHQDLNFAFIIYSLSFLIPMIILNLLLLIKKEVSIVKVTFIDVKLSLVNSFPVFISNFFISFYTNFNSILLAKYTNTTVVGNYFSADRLRVAVQSLLSPVSQAIYPKICSDLEKKDTISFYKYAKIFIFFGFILTISLMIFSKFFGEIYFSSSGYLAAKMLNSMSYIVILVAISTVLGHWYMIGFGFKKELSKIYIICSLLHLIYAYFFVTGYGGVGMIYSTLLTQALIATLMFVFFIKRGFPFEK